MYHQLTGHRSVGLSLFTQTELVYKPLFIVITFVSGTTLSPP